MKKNKKIMTKAEWTQAIKRINLDPPMMPIKRVGYKGLVGLLWWLIKTHFSLRKLGTRAIFTIVLPADKHNDN